VSDELSRVVDWLDDVLAWLREPLTEVPVDRVLERLGMAFQVAGSSWHAQRGPLMTAMITHPMDVLADYPDITAEFMLGGYRDCHPLTVWYERTLSSVPQTSARVPSGLVAASRRRILEVPLLRLGAEHQMTIYYRRDAEHARFFVLARGQRDFDSDDLVVARYVQRSLVTLDCQTQVLSPGGTGDDVPIRTDLDLTGRQLAVLQLLCEGLSTRQSARRLACSPRTVEKHLQHVYRKLEVRDRVNAMRVARLAGVVVDREPGTVTSRTE
jgi:DNA-binding CsgD family transcriptional regulator